MKKNTIDLVNNRRARFVDKDLIPPAVDANDILSIITQANKEKALREELKHSKKKRSQSIFAGQVSIHSNEHLNPKKINGITGLEEPNKESSVSAEELRKRYQFLRGKQVSYGKGRLRSSHNMKGAIEYPYEFISDSYLPDMI